MQNVNEIVSRLNQGESLENIAAELTAVLNEAKKTYDAEKEASARAVEARRVQKREELEYIVRDAAAWIGEFYPDFVKEATKDLDQRDKDELFTVIVDALLEAMDKTAEAIHNSRPMFSFGMDPMSMMLAAELLKSGNAPDKRPVAKATKAKSDDDILNEFLGKICH